MLLFKDLRWAEAVQIFSLYFVGPVNGVVRFDLHYVAMADSSQFRLLSLCTKIGAHCARLSPKSSLAEARQWVLPALVTELGEVEAICQRHGLPDDAERLRDLIHRLSDSMLAVLFPSDEIGARKWLYWAAKDIGKVVGNLPRKLKTYTTLDLCRELDIQCSATLTKYVKMSVVRATKRGERDRRYTSDERFRIFQAVASNAPTDTAKNARKILSEIESKSKARNNIEA